MTDTMQLDDWNIFFILNEKGEEEEFEVVVSFVLEESSYLFASPLAAGEDSDEVYGFRYEEDGDEIQLFNIEDDEEWAKVEEAFESIMTEIEAESES